jgi:type I restriction enzyme S subunit
VRITDIDANGRLFPESHAEADLDDPNPFLLRDGDLLFARSGATVGKTYLYSTSDGPCIFAGYLIRFRLRRTIVDRRFAFYFTRSTTYRDWIESRKHVAAQPNVNGAEYASLPIPLPVVAEQRRIVEILDQADALRRQRAETDEKVQRILPALFHKMFGEPASWEHTACTVPLGQLVDAQGGGTPSTKNPDYWNGGTPWVSPKDMKRDFISDAEDHITELAVQETTSRLIPVSSILVVVRGMILARDVPIAMTEREVAINQDMKALTVTDERVSPLYLFASLKALKPRLLAAIGTAAHGTRKLDTDRLLSMSIAIPDPEKHERFVRWFQDGRRIVDSATGSGPKINRVFDVLLHRAFTGQLTAKWREKHKKQLEAELQEQRRILEQLAAERKSRKIAPTHRQRNDEGDRS